MDQYVAEIRMFAGNFAPQGWAFCNGQIMAISQNTALFSLLGTTYGGNGSSTFGLPNLQGVAPLDAGNGSGLTPRALGETGGSPTVPLTLATMAAHTHTPAGVSAGATITTPAGNLPAGGRAINVYTTPGGGVTTTPMSAQTTGPAGGNQPHNNLQPYLAVTFIIALQGVYPQRP